MAGKIKILPIQVGGTIASAESKDGFKPKRSFEELFSQIDQDLMGGCIIAPAEIPFGEFGMDSAGMQISHIEKIAETIKNNYSNYDAFILTHGTDTLAYTASMLSFLLQGVQKPVIVTGAQKTLSDDNSDVVDNLETALLAALTSNCGVWVAFNGKLIKAVRATKIHIGVECVDAFVSNIGDEIPIAEFQRNDYSLNKGAAEAFNVTLSEAVDIFSLTHTTNPVKLKKYLYSSNIKVLIVLVYGMSGHRPDVIETVAHWARDNQAIVIAKSHSPYGSTDLSKYELGVQALRRGILSSLDMTLESVYAKSSSIIARCGCGDPEQFTRLFYTDLCNEIDEEMVQKYLEREKFWHSSH